MIRVLIADDHPIVRNGLRQILAESGGVEVTAEAGNGVDVLRLVGAQTFDVIVLDINMPGLSGLKVLGQLKAQYPRLPILMLSALSESELAVRVLRAGAAGFLNKELAPEELVTAIRHVAGGRKYISPAVAELLAESIEKGSEPPHASLSEREYQVMCLIASGHTVSEIAEQAGISVKTVSTYRTRILEKMSLKNNAELMLYAIRNGMLDKAV